MPEFSPAAVASASKLLSDVSLTVPAFTFPLSSEVPLPEFPLPPAALLSVPELAFPSYVLVPELLPPGVPLSFPPVAALPVPELLPPVVPAPELPPELLPVLLSPVFPPG